MGPSLFFLPLSLPPLSFSLSRPTVKYQIHEIVLSIFLPSYQTLACHALLMCIVLLPPTGEAILVQWFFISSVNASVAHVQVHSTIIGKNVPLN